MRGLLVVLTGLIGAFVAGVALFNFVVMPRFVQQGATVSVPALVGLSLADAQAVCARSGLHVRVEDRRYSAGIPSDQVLTQIPDPGATVKPGRTVRVHLSLGAETATLPDVRDMSLRQATLTLENANLSVGRIARVYDRQGIDTSGGPTVRAMRPRPGQPIARGGKVDLVVAESSGPEEFLMPDLTGRSFEEAKQRIEAQGFHVTVRSRTAAGTYPGTVLKHTPAAGALVRRGETIELVASTPD